MNDILLSVPSIVIGLFVYELLGRQSGHFSGWAGAIALAFILLPVVVRTTDETMRLIPMYLREVALALGAPRWRIAGFGSAKYLAAACDLSHASCWSSRSAM